MNIQNVLTSADKKKLLQNRFLNSIILGGPEWNNSTRSWLMDSRSLFFSNDSLLLAASLMYEQIRQIEFDYIVCSGLGGLPIVAALKMLSSQDGKPFQMIVIRDAAKDKALRRIVEGKVAFTGARFLFIDDTVTSGATLDRVLEALASVNPVLAGVALLLDAEGPGARKLSSLGVPILSVLSRRECGLSRYEPALSDSIMLKWHASHLNWSQEKDLICNTPTFHEGKLYVNTDSFRTWRMGYDGCIEWEHVSSLDNAPSKGKVSKHVFHGDNVYVTDYNGFLYRLHKDTGKEQAKIKLGDFIHSTPFLDPKNNRLFVAVESFDSVTEKASGKFCCCDMETCYVLWQVDVADYAAASPYYVEEADAVIFCSNEPKCYALSASTGETFWSLNMAGKLAGSVAYANGLIYLATVGGALCAVTPNGFIAWWTILGSYIRHAVLHLDDDYIYVATMNGFVWCVEKITGKRIWSLLFRTGVPQGITSMGEGKAMVVEFTGMVTIIDLVKGTKLASIQLPTEFVNQPAAVTKIAEGKYLAAVATNRDGLFMLDVSVT